VADAVSDPVGHGAGDRRPLSAVRRAVLLTCGFVAVGLGSIGIVVPGLPTTGFFVLAAACFARSSPRFERWVLDLPGVGPMVRDHRAGLGMPRRAKVVAIGMMLTACGLSSWAIGSVPAAIVILGAGAIGTWYVGWRVPTREAVLARRAADTD
jgi:uncharacterized membrane protein YbaN (DUF454 family)